MANTKISALPAAVQANSTDEVAANQAGTSRKVTVDQIEDRILRAGNIDTAEIAADAVTANEIAANAVGSSEISSGAVDTDELAAGAVTLAKMANNSVDTAQIVASAVTLAKMANDSVDTAQIVAGAVDTAELAAAAVTAAKIGSGEVGTTELAPDSVTNNKIGLRALLCPKRQGGDAAEWGQWGAGGTTDYDVTDEVLVQVGCYTGAVASASSGTITITFPQAFSDHPILIAVPAFAQNINITADASVGSSDSQAVVGWETLDGSNVTSISFNWIAIGPE